MKTVRSRYIVLATAAAVATATILPATAAITVPGANGTDGALNITADTVIDLSLAPTGTWDQNNTPNAGKGVYDPAKWAVVFKYTSVTVATGKKLTFKNHASRAPVVWLVSGNVTIDGTVSLDGADAPATDTPKLAEPGPGGFRGGSSWYSASVLPGAGFGPGGGAGEVGVENGYGSYGSVGYAGSAIYGNPALIPLIGGSGGGGAMPRGIPQAAGAGGGAILIASPNTITINGVLSANGGDSWSDYPGHGFVSDPGAGSGGGVRLVSESLVGSGKIETVGGSGGLQRLSGIGRIRVERLSTVNTLQVVPAPSVVDLAAGTTALLWPPAGAPEVKIISLGGVNAPADPKSGFGTIGADVSIPTGPTPSTICIVETTNVEQASQVKVRITPRDTYNFSEVAATYVSTVSPGVLRWTATLPTNLGYSAVQVKVIRP